MAKTLVIAEKPSVGQDLARVLPGPFEKHTGAGDKTARWLEGPDHVITWAVGHLVQLAEPDEYDDKFKKWRMADLPIVPRTFKLVVRDERSEKQMKVVRDQLRRDDIATVVNACDAGREGELIFTYIYEYVKAKKPVQRLWLNSMTNQAMREAFGQLRDGSDLSALRDAAKSRSEADWIVGMNATRAATIRLRSSFDGAVSLGRVQTPTLAIIARREEEIRAFKPEKYWLVDAAFEADGARRYEGRFHDGAQPRLKSAAEAQAIVDVVRGVRGEITKLDKTKRKERPPLLYDLTSLQREANTRYGFSARRTLGAAQRCYEEHKALTYPRTSSRYLTSDMVPEFKEIAGKVGRRPEYSEAAGYVQSLDLLPLGRVVDDAKVGDHHAIIPTNSEHDLGRMNDDDRRVYDLVTRRFLAVFHPDAEFENTRVETTVASHIFRTRGKVLLVAGWRGVYGELSEGDGAAADDDEGRDQQLPRLERGEAVDTRDVESLEKETKPPRRYTDAAGGDGDGRQARRRRGDARGDEGVGHRDSGHARGDHRAPDRRRLCRARRALARRHREGRQRGAPAGRASADLARADRRLGASPGGDRGGHRAPREVHGGHRRVRRQDGRRARHDAQGRADPARQSGPVPCVRQRHRREPQGLLVLVARGPGLRLRHLEVQGRQADPGGGRARADRPRIHRPGGDRLQGTLGALVPGEAGARAGRRRGLPLAGGVRRAVGQGGRQAAGGRRGNGRGGGR
jgi:DNA topoisomerase III